MATISNIIGMYVVLQFINDLLAMVKHRKSYLNYINILVPLLFCKRKWEEMVKSMFDQSTQIFTMEGHSFFFFYFLMNLNTPFFSIKQRERIARPYDGLSYRVLKMEVHSLILIFRILLTHSPQALKSRTNPNIFKDYQHSCNWRYNYHLSR